MEWFLSLIDTEWLKSNYVIILLTGAVAVEWIVLQAFIVHYMMRQDAFPTFDRERSKIESLERLSHFQSSQIERLYAKIGEISRDLATAQAATKSQAKSMAPADRSMLTMGEISLKKRLTELTQNETKRTTN